VSAQALRVRPATARDRAAWDDFVARRPDAVPYQLWAWGEAVASAYGWDVARYVAEEEDRVEGVLAAVCLGRPLGPRAWVCLPYCDVGEALAGSEAAAAALYDAAAEAAHVSGARFLEVRRAHGARLEGPRGKPVTTASGKVRLVLPLPGGAAALWGSFSSKLRSQVRKAEKNGLTFGWGSDPEVDDFYRVFARNMRDLGSPVHSRRWFREVLRAYGPRARLGLVWHQERPVAGGVLLLTETSATIPWASTLREANALAPNMLLYWKFLEFAAEAGYASFDFGRSTPGEGTYRFKAQWGAEPRPLAWSTVYLAGSAANPSDGPSLARAAAERVWRRLPVALANVLGPAVRKYISL
jgi:FemAB-related protein (PEP-CTERM system-associated)